MQCQAAPARAAGAHGRPEKHWSRDKRRL